MLKSLLLTLKLGAIALILIALPFDAKAAWGNYDPTFGFAGVAVDISATNYSPFSVAVQPDGKILVTGARLYGNVATRFFLRRYLSNGAVDTSFGTNGTAIGPENNGLTSRYVGHAIVVYNNKIAVAGRANDVYAVWRFNMDGTKDTTFGTNGLQVLSNYLIMGSRDAEIDVQDQNLILTIPKTAMGGFPLAMLRLTSTGTLDTTFGNAGESLRIYHGYYTTHVEANGKIMSGGRRYDDDSVRGLERKLANGQDDPLFQFLTLTTSGESSSGLVRMTNNKYAMRSSYPAASGFLGVIIDKFSAAGAPQIGLVLSNAQGNGDCPEIFASQNDGKLVTSVSGVIFRTDNEIRTGSLESINCSNLVNIDSLTRATLQSDDKMVAAGIDNNNLILIRTLPD